MLLLRRSNSHPQQEAEMVLISKKKNKGISISQLTTTVREYPYSFASFA
jgi:hypothetical protein